MPRLARRSDEEALYTCPLPCPQALAEMLAKEDEAVEAATALAPAQTWPRPRSPTESCLGRRRPLPRRMPATIPRCERSMAGVTALILAARESSTREPRVQSSAYGAHVDVYSHDTKPEQLIKSRVLFAHVGALVDNPNKSANFDCENCSRF